MFSLGLHVVEAKLGSQSTTVSHVDPITTILSRVEIVLVSIILFRSIFG